MSGKTPNTDIRCGKENCAFHCKDCGYCSLQSIQIAPCDANGCTCDATKCASYRHD